MLRLILQTLVLVLLILGYLTLAVVAIFGSTARTPTPTPSNHSRVVWYASTVSTSIDIYGSMSA
jgi:hypothetical protein